MTTITGQNNTWRVLSTGSAGSSPESSTSPEANKDRCSMIPIKPSFNPVCPMSIDQTAVPMDIPSINIQPVIPVLDASAGVDLSTMDLQEPSEIVRLNDGMQIDNYQMDAINWMASREQKQAKGGILCADLGLGKTPMSLYRIAQVKNQGPSLYVCAKTLLLVVRKEMEKFFNQPGKTKINYLIMHPDITDRNYIENLTANEIRKYDLIITTYEVCIKSADLTNAYERIFIKGIGGFHDNKVIGYRQPRDVFDEFTVNSLKGYSLIHYFPWNLKVLDEAQCMNDPRTDHFRSVASIISRVSICLSGTPIRNREGDIWSLLFVCGYTGVNNPINWNRNKFVGDVKNMLYVIDYTMAGVTLPEKHNHVYELIPSNNERKIYRYFLEDLRNNYNEFANGKPGAKYAVILGLFSLLRLLCIAPYLITPESKSKTYKKKEITDNKNDLSKALNKEIRELEPLIHDIKLMGHQSTKIAKILDIIDQLLEENKNGADHRILIFSSFVSVLNLIADALKHRYLSGNNNNNKDLYRILSGKTDSSDRDLYIKDFNDGKFPIMMLIYKVGSFGLNLQTANHVIPVDPWWNYVVEQQAEARVWRRGQVRPVHVHRVVMKGTIEEPIREIASAKNQNSMFYLGKGNGNNVCKLPSLDRETLGRILFHSLTYQQNTTETIDKIDASLNPNLDNINLNNDDSSSESMNNNSNSKLVKDLTNEVNKQNTVSISQINRSSLQTNNKSRLSKGIKTGVKINIQSSLGTSHR